MSSLRHKIAQMLVMGFSGLTLKNTDKVVKWVKDEGIGGVILFDIELSDPRSAKNLADTDQIKQLTADLQTYASAYPDNLPLFIALDYEGGEVDRLKNIPTCPKTLKPVEMTALNETQRLTLFDSMAHTLKKLGFNLNFAPVVDLAFEVEEGIIGRRGRSFASEPEQMVEMASSFVTRFKAQGVLCCYKHFPGHGSARGDTHLGFVDVTDTFDMKELTPYPMLFKQAHESVMVMTAHVVNRHLDPSGLPATLSSPILTHLLRQEFQFDGVVISDDLQMRAISAQYPLVQALQMTINAGTDMLIFGNQWGSHDASELIDLIEGMVKDEKIPEKRIEEAYMRILKLKRHIDC